MTETERTPQKRQTTSLSAPLCFVPCTSFAEFAKNSDDLIYPCPVSGIISICPETK